MERTEGGVSLGPLLWNLFQNDLLLHRQSAYLFMYAEDHQIYTVSGNTRRISKFQSSLESLDCVLKSWDIFSSDAPIIGKEQKAFEKFQLSA